MPLVQNELRAFFSLVRVAYFVNSYFKEAILLVKSTRGRHSNRAIGLGPVSERGLILHKMSNLDSLFCKGCFLYEFHKFLKLKRQFFSGSPHFFNYDSDRISQHHIFVWWIYNRWVQVQEAHKKGELIYPAKCETSTQAELKSSHNREN